MAWTSERPKVAGWYWISWISPDKTIGRVYEIRREFGWLMMGFESLTTQVDRKNQAVWWDEPIEVPTSPEDDQANAGGSGESQAVLGCRDEQPYGPARRPVQAAVLRAGDQPDRDRADGQGEAEV